MKKMEKTKFAWDGYMYYLITTINESSFMKRAEDKPMATPKTAEEMHVTTRAIHLKESAEIAKRIAKELGLNYEYIYAAMLMHDAGHPFSAHEGEVIFNEIGDVYNTQYFHHNAKGIEIILSENLCEKAISKIPNIENNPELRKQLKEDFVYFLDAVISHDGEATREDMMKPEISYATIEEAVQEKMRLANSKNTYKFIAQTPEGKIAKFADVLAYLQSDMQDAFRLGIMEGFSNEYLELFGEMFANEYPEIKGDKIECGKRIIDKIMEENLRGINSNFLMEMNNKDIRGAVKRIREKVRKESLNINDQEDIGKIEEIVEQEQERFRIEKMEEFFNTVGKTIPEDQRSILEETIARKSEQGISLNEIETEFVRTLNTINSNTNKIEEFATKILRVESNAVSIITSKMKEFFIRDLIENSQDKDTPQFSDKGWDLFFKAKKLNYKEYVVNTNWNYQTKELPQAAMELTRACAESLIKSGAIRNKFYDDAVRKHIKDDEALQHMETQYRPEKQYVSYRKENGIGNLKALAKPSKGQFTGSKEQYELMKMLAGVYKYVQKQEEVFAIRYENTFNAIKTRLREKIELALSEQHTVKEQHLFKEVMQGQIDEIRQQVLDIYGRTELTPDEKEEFISGKIAQELKTMEQKMAMQLATDYLAGMSDKTFIDRAIKTGYLSPEAVENALRGTSMCKEVVNLMKRMEQEEDAAKGTNGPGAPNRNW